MANAAIADTPPPAPRLARPDELPVIDLADVLAGRPGAVEAAAATLREACLRIGFFYVAGHGVPPDLVDRAFAGAASFHAQPAAAKLALRIDRDNVGYMPMGAQTVVSTTVAVSRKASQNEAFFVKNEIGPEHPRFGRPFFGANRWPDGLPGFRETALAYMARCNALAGTLLELYAVALGLPPDWFARHPGFREPGYRLRMSHYPPTPPEADLYGLSAHTDYSFLTILAQSAVPGLEIRTRGGEWITAPSMPGTFLVNTGDMCMRMTNDRFVSTPHRVVNRTSAERYAIPFFFTSDAEVPMETVPTCTGPDAPPRYEPISHGDYFRMRINANYHHQRTSA
ncbi:MAG: isopenicillin N synthase family dioxygenase [Alphaproteobacteria bacterium]